MLYILYGEDDFSVHEFLGRLRAQIGPEELADTNTSTLDGAMVTTEQLLQVSCVAPFLTERRLVVVRGLFRRFESRGGQQRQGRSARSRNRAADEWSDLAGILVKIPETTVVVFVEGPLRRDNPLVRQVASMVEAREFPVLRGQALNEWIHGRVSAAGAVIDRQAIRLLVEYVGGDLWALSGEIEKLALYSTGEEIGEEAVRLLVGQTRQVSVFDAIDAVLASEASMALQKLSRLLQDGADVSYVIAMLARQLRLILLVQELLGERVPRAELGRRVGITADFVLRRTERQARSYAQEQVVAMHRRLLETDLAIKQGEIRDDLALETLVAELCGGAATGLPLPSRR